MTAPQEVQLWRGRHLDISEVEQMRNRIKYITLCYQFTEVERHEVDPCGHCGARFDLEGLTASAALPRDGAHKSVERERKRERERSFAATVQELTALKKLKDEQALDADEYKRLKQKLLDENL